MDKNPYRIRLSERAEDYGYDNVDEYLANCCNDSILTALCTEECSVEPDGRCSHGCPSPLLAAGLI